MQSRTTSLSLDRKGRLGIPPQPAPRQAASERVHNWDEVFLGFDVETAVVEANRCIQCPAAPCTKACPLQNDIPGALWLLEHGEPLAAANIFRQTSNMPEVCGRVCPQEKLCEGSCVVGRNGRSKPVQIGKLEQFCADSQRRQRGLPVPEVTTTGRPVAVVGAGPAGIAAAEELTKLGHPVTMYDAWPKPGGTLRYGIPNFKLNKGIVDAKINQLEAMGITLIPNKRFGSDVTLDSLEKEGFGAVFLGYGATLGNRLDIPGEDLPGVYSATEFLVRANLSVDELPGDLAQPLGGVKSVVVVGGGDTASDCVRTAVRLGAESVTQVYRRSETEMPGRLEERHYARDEGVKVHFLAAPVRVIGEGRVQAIEFVRMELGEPDASGRRSPRPVAGSEFTVEADTLVVAAGYHADSAVAQALSGVNTRSGGIVVADAATGRTSRPGVFAGGDLATGPHLVVTAVAAGRRAAKAIHEHLSQSRT